MRSTSRSRTVRRPSGGETAGQFSLLFQNNPLPIWVFDRDSLCFLEVNEAAAKHYGYSRDEFLQMRITDIHPGEDGRWLRKQLEKRRAGSFYSGEWRHQTKDGRLLDVEAVSRAIQFNGCKAVLVIAQDVTARKRSEQILRESEEQYRLAFENASVGLGLADMSGNLLAFNDAMLRPGGYSRDDIWKIGNVSLLYADPSQRAKVLSLFRRQGFVHEYEVQFMRKDGTAYDALLSLAKIDIKGQSYIQAMVEDITERRRAERALQEAESRYRTLVEQLPMIIYSNTPGDITSTRYVSPQVESILGYSPEEWLGHPKFWEKALHPEDRQRVLAEVKRIDRTGEAFDAEYRMIARDGHIVWFRDQAILSRDAEGKPLFWHGFMVDVTERRRTEEALQASEGELRALFAALPDLIQVMDKDGRYLKIAPTNPDLLYMPADEVLGKRMHDIFSRQKADQFVRYIRKALRIRQPVQFEYALLIRDRIMWFSGAVAPLTYDTVVWAARDITSQKVAQEQIERRLNELEALHESALSLSQSLDPKEIGQKVIKVLADRLNWHHAAVRVRREDSDEVELLAFSQASEPRKIKGTGQLIAQQAITHVGEGISGWVIQHGRMVNSGSLKDDPRYHETFAGMRSGLYAPIWAGGRVLGCISAESNQHEAFNEADERFLTTLASQAAIALENSRLFEQTQRRAQEFETLYSVTHDVSFHEQDLQSLLQTLVERAVALLRTYGGGMYLYDPSRGDLELAFGVRDEEGRGARVALGEGAAGHVAQTRTPLVIDNYQTWEGRRPHVEHIPFRAVLQVPMLYGGELIGVLDVFEYGDSRRKFSEQDVKLLSLFAAHAASAVYNARLFEKTRRSATEFASLYETARDMAAQQDLDQLLATIVRRAGALLNAPVSGIYLYDESRNDLYVAVNQGLPSSLGVRLALGEGVAGRVAQTRQPMIVDDYQSWEGRSAKYDGVPIRSVLQVPMLYGGELIGVLTVDEIGDSQRKFTQEDADLLSLFASHAASAIYSARLLENARRRAEEFKELYEVTHDVSLQQDITTLLTTIVERATKLLDTPRGGIYLYDTARGDLVSAVRVGTGVQAGIRLRLGQGAAGRVAQTRQPLIIDDYQTWEGRSLKYEGVPLRAILQVPMLYGGELVGVLSVDEYGADSTRKFTEADARLLSLFASTAASAIYSARLLESTRRRAEELGVLSQISLALRTASSRAEMTPIILFQLREVLHADGAMFITLKPSSQEMVVELAQGSIQSRTGLVIPPGQGLSIQVMRSRQVYVTSDLHSDPRVFQPDLLRDARCAAIVPLIAQDHNIGVLWVTRDQKNEVQPAGFTENEINLLVAIADMTANALQRAFLHEQTTHYAEQLVTINAMAHDLSQMLDLPGIYEKVSRSVLGLLPDTATMFISFVDRRAKLITAVYGLQDGQVVNVSALPPAPFDESGAENLDRVILNGEPLIVPDLIEPLREAEAADVDVLAWRKEQQMRSALYVPLQAEGQVIGVLQLQSYSRNRYTAADAELLGLVANTAAAAIQNARLFAQLKHRVDQLSALHAVDAAISSTTDLRISLHTVLENVTRQMKVDAASVLLLNPATLTLQYIASEGFLTSQITRTSFSLGKGQTGVAALERRIIRIPDLATSGVELAHSGLVAAERFTAYLAVPLIAKGEVRGVLEIFHRAPLDLDEERTSFLEMLAGQAALAIDNALLFESLEKANVELTMAYDATIEGWSQALELRDQETRGHSARVMELTLRLAAAMGLSDKELKDIRRGVLLHDIGKMGIPDSILHKPGPLTDQEGEIMRKHPQYAYDMLAPIAYLRSSLDIPYCHHEKWDGTGYPRALRGETIPLAARIFSVVDVYDALTSDRSYRAAWPGEKAIAYILEQSGKHFDPGVVEFFIKVIDS